MTDPVDLLLPPERLGATVRHHDDGSTTTRFEVWAPRAGSVELVLEEAPGPDAGDGARRRAMTAAARAGHWECEVAGAAHGTRYRFSIDGAEPLPDPASAWQPDGVHGPSAVVDTAGFGCGHEWRDHDWRGIALEDAVVYELHIGTFTPGGTFDSAVEQLPALVELGVTVVEVMPVNAFPGARNWGYDGVFPGAVQESYGGPAGLARFVDAAHRHGLAVILDVVFNHLGPEGNVLPRFGPYFTDAHHTPWGDALNVAEAGSDGVRRFLLDVVRRFVADHHVDGYRLDAVHAVVDPTANPVWEQVATVVRAAARPARRRTLVIAETADNDPRYLRGPDRGGMGLDAVWNDDLHHVLHVALTGDRHGYYADYEGTAAELADVLQHRWAFRGRYSIARGRLHGRPVDDVAPHRFVVCLQNHDQVGNRPLGDRIATDPASRRMATAVTLLSPFTPLLFMGEEYDEPAPFPFFVDHGDPDLLDATRRGRRAEFPQADWAVEVPDPADPATFASAVLNRSRAARAPHDAVLAMYTELLRLRREVAPVRSPSARQRVELRGEVVMVHRTMPDRARSVLVCNVGAEPALVDSSDHPGTALDVAFDSSDPRWGGDGGTDVTGDRTVRIAPRTAALLVATG